MNFPELGCTHLENQIASLREMIFWIPAFPEIGAFGMARGRYYIVTHWDRKHRVTHFDLRSIEILAKSVPR